MHFHDMENPDLVILESNMLVKGGDFSEYFYVICED